MEGWEIYNDAAVFSRLELRLIWSFSIAFILLIVILHNLVPTSSVIFRRGFHLSTSSML
jgi:hypothetical protein